MIIIYGRLLGDLYDWICTKPFFISGEQRNRKKIQNSHAQFVERLSKLDKALPYMNRFAGETSHLNVISVGASLHRRVTSWLIITVTLKVCYDTESTLKQFWRSLWSRPATHKFRVSTPIIMINSNAFKRIGIVVYTGRFFIPPTMLLPQSSCALCHVELFEIFDSCLSVVAHLV